MRIRLIFNIRFYLLLFVLFSIPFFVPGSPLIKDAQAGTYRLVRSVIFSGGEMRTLSTKIYPSGVPPNYILNAYQGYAFDAPGPDLIPLWECYEAADTDYHPCTPQSANWSDPRNTPTYLIGYIYDPNISQPPNAQPIYRCHHRYIDDDDSTGGNIKDGEGFTSIMPLAYPCDWSTIPPIRDEALGYVLKTPFSVDDPQPSCSGLQPVLTVTWERYSTATYYKVFRVDPSTAPNGVRVGSDIPQVPVGQTPSFPDTGPDNNGGLIQAGGDYAYRVKAFNNSGPIAGIDDTGPYFNSIPMCVNAPVQSCVGPTPNLAVQWSPVSGAAYYRIRRVDSFSALKVRDDWTQTSFKDNAQAIAGTPPLITNNIYSYRIIAKNSAGTTLPNQNVTGLPNVAGACVPPTLSAGPLVKECTTGSPALKVQWTQATHMLTGPSSYTIKREIYQGSGFINDSSFNSPPPIPYPANLNSNGYIEYIDSTVIVGQRYRYVITAYNGFSSGAATTADVTVTYCDIQASCTGSSSPTSYAGPGTSITWQTTGVTGGNGTYTYAWSNPDPVNSPWSDPLNDKTGPTVTIPGTLAVTYPAQVTISSSGVPNKVPSCPPVILTDNTLPVISTNLKDDCFTDPAGNNPWPGSFTITAYDNESPGSVTVSTVGVRVKDGGSGYSDTCENTGINSRLGGCACSNNNQCSGAVSCTSYPLETNPNRKICYSISGLCGNLIGRPDVCDCISNSQCASGLCFGGSCGKSTPNGGLDNYTGGSWWLNSGVAYNWAGESTAPTGLTTSTGVAGNDYTVPFPYINFKTPASHSEFKNSYTFRAEATSLGGTKTEDTLFDIKTVCTFPYLQTTQGDVHTNEDIDQP